MKEVSLKQLKQDLKNAWVDGYDCDETFYVCYSNGLVLNTKESNDKLPLTNIIGILFMGSDTQCYAGKII